MLPPVLSIGEGVFELDLECLVDLFKFAFVFFVELSHLLPHWHHVIDVVLPGALVHGIDLFVHAAFLLEPFVDSGLIEVE